MKFSETIIKIL